MSVLIKGVQMPTGCADCPLLSDWDICQATGREIEHLTDERMAQCPLVEMPTPHGRLIDADALQQPIGSYNPIKYTYEYGDVITVADIDTAPTIIEAEES